MVLQFLNEKFLGLRKYKTKIKGDEEIAKKL